jgi:hypothetical protein
VHVRAHVIRFWLLVIVLALGVATLEAPEFASLCDDISNDAVVVSLDDWIPKLTTRPLCRGETPRRASDRSSSSFNLSHQRGCTGRSLNASSKAGKDILHLISTQKK